MQSLLQEFLFGKKKMLLQEKNVRKIAHRIQPNLSFHSISSVAIELGGMQQQRTTYLSYFAIFIRRKRKQTVALLQALYHDKPTYNLNQKKQNTGEPKRKCQKKKHIRCSYVSEDVKAEEVCVCVGQKETIGSVTHMRNYHLKRKHIQDMK